MINESTGSFMERPMQFFVVENLSCHPVRGEILAEARGKELKGLIN